VLPDLPYVREDVPGGSEATRFARQTRSRPTPGQPASIDAGAPTRPLVGARILPTYARRAVTAVLVSVLGLALLAPYAAADDLTDQRERVKRQLAKTSGDLNESSKALSAAARSVDRTEAQLSSARASLARTKQELAVASAADLKMAGQLRRAQADLATAKAKVVLGQRNLDAETAVAGEAVRDQYQQHTSLFPLAVLVDVSSPADFQTRLQWSTTMFDTTQAEIDRLTVVQQQLTAARARQAQLEAQVATDRKAAAATLRTKRSLEQRAVAEEATVEGLLEQRQAIERAAADDVAEDKAQYARLESERASVEQRIAIRIAQAKAAADRKAAAERAAKIAARKAAAAKKAREQARAEARRSAARKHHSSAKKSASTSKSIKKKATRKKATKRTSKRSSMASASHGFSYPVSAPITSPFGMRYHPVLHYWKLHDGTDFGAGCGTAIRAPSSGRVAEKYWNAGYGNRLMIDHGFHSGRYVTTGYNHATGYTVHVGQHVRKGQVIGYVGTTGFSTGCHLHLMVWLNGRVVNPMTWF